MKPASLALANRPAGTLFRLSAVVLLLLLPALSACSVLAPAAPPVTLRFAFPEADAEAYRTLAASFKERNSHITVELLPKSWGALDRLAAEEADVFVQNSLAFNNLRSAGKVLNVDAWLQADNAFKPADFYPGTIALFKAEGKTWGIPSGIDPWVLYYNRALFDAQKLAYPADWRWEQFLQAALALRQPDSNTYGYIARSIADPALFVYQHGGTLVDDWQNPTRTTLDDPLTIEAMEWWAALFTTHKVAPAPEQVRAAGGAEASIYRGQVGMWFGQLSERGGLTWPRQYQWQMPWGMAPLPRDARPATVALAEAYFISAKTAHAKESWQWIAYLSANAPTRLAPARKSALESEAYARQIGADNAQIVRMSLAQALLVRPIEFSGFERGIEDIANGRVPVREALPKLQQTVK